MKKALIDGSKTIVGVIDVPRGMYGNVEYGRRDKNGILHTHGIARLVNLSDIPKKQREMDSTLDIEWEQ